MSTVWSDSMRNKNDLVYGIYKGLTIYKDINLPEYYVRVKGEEVVEDNVRTLKARVDWLLKKDEVLKNDPGRKSCSRY